MSLGYSQAPPPLLNVLEGGVSSSTQYIPTEPRSLPPSPSKHVNLNSFIIVAFVVAVCVFISSALYFLIRLFSQRRRPNDVASGTSSVHPHHSDRYHHLFIEERPAFIRSLPEFTFEAVAAGGGGGAAKDRDCAICLAKFQPQDRLRLLPICCHAFHANCVDSWLVSNQTCPLCRSSIDASESDLMKTVLMPPDEVFPRGESFRIEIGNISSRQASSVSGDGRRSYSIGSFSYVVDEESEISVDATHRPIVSDKDEAGVTAPVPPGAEVAAEVAVQRSWLREYVERLASTASSSSRALSFRSSGRFFTGSSRRSEAHGSGAGDGAFNDLEANRLEDEISEMFRWFSWQ